MVGFRAENSGISCLDTSVTLVAKTLGGDPLAGQDSIIPIECEETIDIDVDPFNAVNTIRPNDSYNVTVAGIACGDTELEVVGNKITGVPLEGLDSIVTEDCDAGGYHP